MDGDGPVAGSHLFLGVDLLAAQSELGDDGAVALNVDACEVVEQTTTATNKHQQAATAVV